MITGCENLQLLNTGLSIKKFKANYNNDSVVIRVYENDEYYGDRYLREKNALEALWNYNRKNYQFLEFPKIIEEFDENKIRILEWIEGNQISVNEITISILDVVSEINNIKQLHPKYSLINDILSHLQNIKKMNIEDKNRYIDLISPILDYCKNLLVEKSDNILVHGDFFHENLINVKDSEKLGVIDWEYATYGPKYYDLAYFHVFSEWSPPSEIINEINLLKPIVISFICHWYLNFQNLNRKLCIYWLNRLEKCSKQIV